MEDFGLLQITCPHCEESWIIKDKSLLHVYMKMGPEWTCKKCRKDFRVKGRWFNARETTRPTGNGKNNHPR